jgi:hypothetical protein
VVSGGQGEGSRWLRVSEHVTSRMMSNTGPRCVCIVGVQEEASWLFVCVTDHTCYVHKMAATMECVCAVSHDCLVHEMATACDVVSRDSGIHMCDL